MKILSVVLASMVFTTSPMSVPQLASAGTVQPGGTVILVHHCKHHRGKHHKVCVQPGGINIPVP